jgi:4-amino-4-deoxy-L-arabinose transferase-like glycosyltransferase
MRKEYLRHYILIFIIIIFGLSLRLYNLEADPDIKIDGDTGIFTDEGLYSLSARNLALFGTFNANPNSRVVEAVDSPIYTYSEYLSFKLFGVNIKAMRLPSILFSLLTILTAYLVIGKIFGLLEGIVVLVFLSLNYMFIQYNRLALLETLMTLLFMVSSYFYFMKGGTRYGFILSGLFAGCALITKGTAVFFIPPVLLSMAIEKRENRWWRHTARSIVLFVLGVCIPVMLNKIYLDLVLKDLAHLNTTTNNLLQVGRDLFYFGSIGEWMKSITQILISRLSIRMPEIFFFVYVYAIWIIGKFKKPETQAEKATCFFLLWLMAGIFALSFFTYQPNRYRVPFIIPLCILAAIGIGRISRLSGNNLTLPKSKSFWFALVIGCTMLLFRIGRIFLVSIVGKSFHLNEIILLISIFISFCIAVIVKKYFSFNMTLPQYARKWIVSALIVTIIITQTGQYIRWSLNQVFEIKKGNQVVGELIESGNVGGEYAPILCLETDNIVVPLHKEDRSRLPKLCLTHYIDSVQYRPNNDYQLLNQLNPGFLDEARLLTTISVGYTHISLYAFKK